MSHWPLMFGARTTRKLWPVLSGALVALLAAGALLLLRGRPRKAAPAAGVPPATASDHDVFAQYAGSQSCKDCHTNAFAGWRRSHHALAERPVEAGADLEAFNPPRRVRHGTQESEVKADARGMLLLAPGREARPAQLERVIGEAPLRQFLAREAGGRWQATELAYDPARREWFDVFGNEDRLPGEWGHWTGRGMTWNQMCASCHNTRLRKHYEPQADSYGTTMAEPAVGCEACHGPMQAHVRWQKARPQPAKGDPTLPRIDHGRTMAACGMCHARRGEINGEFVPGDDFNDHFLLTIVDGADTYYPDGQVRDEDYEYASFLSSKMFGAGVWCMDCHDPHGGKVKASDNSLCMRCHGTPLPPAPRIDEAKHSFHPAGKEGSRCVDCHMPQTAYMQRHARRDHGFTIPDPLLTKQHGIPNACNRCHKDKDTEWSLAAVDKWYGRRMERPTRARAQVIAQAREGGTNAVPALAALARTEKLGYWRASAARLLGEFPSDPAAKPALIERAGDHNPIVRASAAHALMGLVHEADAAGALERLLRDEVRAVRIEAAWALHSTVDTNIAAGRELLASLDFNADQPAGAMQWGTFLLDRGDAPGALPWFEKAVAWDGHSAPLCDSLAVCYSSLGRTAEAVRELEAACRLAPREAQLRYRLGLGLNEAGRLNEAIGALEETVKLDPRLSSAWYNLGLGYAQAERLEDALSALLRAENLEQNSPRAPYARATILAKLGRTDEARRAAQRALELRRDFAEAQQLLQSLP